MTTRASSSRWVGCLAALCFFAGHIPFLAWFLDDIDPINFALGIRQYDIAHHQPHPPGYPIYILLGKIATWAMRTVGWHPRGDIEAGALAIWGIIGGALAALPLIALFLAIDGDRERPAQAEDGAGAIGPIDYSARARVRAVAAMALTLANPLFWFTAGRPLSDVVGLAAALAAQALFATAFARQGRWSDGRGEAEGHRGAAAPPAAETAATGRLIVLGALVAGLAVGLRSQTAWLTVPALALVILDRAGRGAAGALLGSLVTFGLGALAWFVPMVIVTGGPAAYWRALSSQAREDFSGVDMLATSAAPLRRLLFNLIETCILPWSSVPLALIVLICAGIGLIVMLWRARRGVALLAAIALPYAVLHLLFQENATTRYALPLVPPLVYLAVRGLDAVLRRTAIVGVGVAALVVASLSIGAPALRDYAQGTSPIFALFDDLHRAPVEPARPPVVAMHRRIFNESRRAREWAGAAFPWTVLPATQGHEWLELVKYWRDQQARPGGVVAPVWFLADPRRTDLALIDATMKQHVQRYRWPVAEAKDPLSRFFLRKFPEAFDDPAFIGGARPDEMDWYVIDRPGWFLAEGWALTPETAGVAQVDGAGPSRPGGIVAYIRRRPEEVRLMIGGRNLGAKGDPVVRFTASLDGRVLDTWDILPDPGFFLRAFTLPAGTLMAPGASAGAGGADAGVSEYGRFTVQAWAADDSSRGTNGHPPVAASVEQFDLQPSSAVMFGYDTGWHELEYKPETGAAWRWSSAASALRVWNAGHDVTVRLRAESPLRDFADPPIVSVRAGKRVLQTFTAAGEVNLALDVPATVLDEGGGALVLAMDRTFSPAERHAGVADRRRLGLRVVDVSITQK